METELKSTYNRFKNFLGQIDSLKDLKSDIIAIIFSLIFLYIPMETVPTAVLEILRVVAIVMLVLGLVSIITMVLKQVLNVQISRNNIAFVLDLLLICSLYPKLEEENLNSISYTLSLIISVFCIRDILFRLYLLWWQKTEMDENSKIFKASVNSYFLIYIIYLLFCHPFNKVFQLNIFLIILVYGFYDLVKIKYLSSKVKHSYINENTIINLFEEVKNVDYYAWIIVLIMFLLYNFQIFNISDSQTLYYFYSASAQIFAALLGIVAMFGILILQKNEFKAKTKNNALKNGIRGFLIIYTSVIILSITGILVSRSITLDRASLILEIVDISSMGDLINLTIFESTFLMIPAALLYLYAMIVDFLKLDETNEDKSQKSLDNY